MCFAWQAQGFRHVAKYVAGAGVREGCKNVGGRGGFEEAPKRCVSRGRRRDFDTLQNTWQAQESVRVAKTLAGVVDLKQPRNGRRRDFVLCGVDV